MTRKIWNPSAEQTVTQINSTLAMLQEKALAISYNLVDSVDPTEHECNITWHNHQPSRANTGKAFCKLDQYFHILSNNSYHCLLYDGSIIRVNFEFEDNVLLVENLLWWPSPYNLGSLLHDGYPPLDLLLDFYNDPKWFDAIQMRSPVRIDYDSKKDSKDHPRCHMHIQHEETRIKINKPICFNKFIQFIIHNFFSGFYLSFSQSDFLIYDTEKSKDIIYGTSEIIIK